MPWWANTARWGPHFATRELECPSLEIAWPGQSLLNPKAVTFWVGPGEVGPALGITTSLSALEPTDIAKLALGVA